MRKRTLKKLGFANAFEKQVYDTLWTEFSGEKAKVLHDCFFFWRNGKPSQTDVVMVSRRGVFMVECKDYSGSVEGTDDDGDFYWKQVVRHDDGTVNEYSFLNPLYQNYMHIQCLKKNIHFEDVPIYSVVVFSDKCNISKVKFSRPNTVVSSFSRICGQIVLLGASSRSMLSNDEIVKLTDEIMSVAGAPEDREENQQKLINGRKAKVQALRKQLWVRYIGGPTKKGLEPGKTYEVLKEDKEFYWLAGIRGKSLKSRFEICDEE